MSKRVVMSVFTISLVGSVFAWGRDDKNMKMPAQKAGSHEFQQIKQLVGTWTGMMTHPGRNEPAEVVSTQFKITAAGSVIEETLMPGTPHEMVDMYIDENGRLAMTHYCALGNQPHMVLRQASPYLISLEMGPTQGILPNDPHMHALTLEFPDANHLTERWTSYQNGKPSDTSVFTFSRVK
jgi:hypothetical protein